ncbi:MAG: hypothetical protein GX780_03705 [Campylobacteraceae bacterium]|nr:hypothetical protein [Campylobacteraceae bacterium]
MISRFRPYVWYKLLNSLFFGLSTGSVFILYTPLKPSIYSLGGIVLALGLLVVAKWYERMMNRRVFFAIALLVEYVTLAMVAYFLLFSYSYMTALLVYVAYQFTFIFGGYLLRVETLALSKSKLLSIVDVAKQKGYLLGMVMAFLFYKLLELQGMNDKQTQVYILHFGLLAIQLAIIFLIYKSFLPKRI